jgi:carnitine-CoA ligase
VIAVPSELGEDEVMACVVPREGAPFEPAELVAFCAGSWPLSPRYVELIRELPLTPSGKVEKYRLRDRGVTAATWDREGSDPDSSL